MEYTLREYSIVVYKGSAAVVKPLLQGIEGLFPIESQLICGELAVVIISLGRIFPL